MRDALRLLQQRHQEDVLKLRRLRKAIQEGEDALARGNYVDVDLEELPEFLVSLGAAGRKSSKA